MMRPAHTGLIQNRLSRRAGDSVLTAGRLEDREF